MQPWLEMQFTDHERNWPDCQYVFHWLKKPLGAHLKGWKEACVRAKLPGLKFHDLRRSAGRNMERAGIPRNIAMSITGHRTESVYRRYDIVSDRDYIGAQRSEDQNGHSAGTEWAQLPNTSSVRSLSVENDTEP